MARQVYKLANGKRVCGATTIIGELGWSRPFLMKWAFDIGKEHPELSSTFEYSDPLAEIGTIAHELVMRQHKGEPFPANEYSQNQTEIARRCLASYNNWAKGKVIEPILLEAPLVSEKYQFGGQPDFYGKVDNVLTLVDYKTGKSIYDEYKIQTGGAYRLLLEEHGHKVERIVILNIPRSKGESFQELEVDPSLWNQCEKVFLNCLELYKLHQIIKGG